MTLFDGFTPEIDAQMEEQKRANQEAYAQRMEIEREDNAWRDLVVFGEITSIVGGRDQYRSWVRDAD